MPPVWTSGRLDSPDVEAVADTAPRVRTVAAPSVIAMLNACAPRLQSADEVTGALAGQGGVERRSPPWQPLSTQPRRSTWARSATLDRLSAACQRPISGSVALGQARSTLQPARVARHAGLERAREPHHGPPEARQQPASRPAPTGPLASARIRAVSALAAGAVGDDRRVEIMGGTVPGWAGGLGTPGTQRRWALQDLSGRRRSGPRRSPWRASGSYG